MHDALITFGDAVKATTLEDGRVKLGGYLVRFGGPDKTDLTGEYFTPNTDFGGATKSAVYFHHRLPLESMGGFTAKPYKSKLGDAELKFDEVGVWAEVVLEMIDEYQKMIADMGIKGLLGWSSGTAPHLVEYKSVGNAQEITMWPLGLDASLTPTPAEPRNVVVTLKSLYDLTEETPAEDTPEAAPAAAVQAETQEDPNIIKELPMSEPIETVQADPVDVEAIVASTVEKTIKALKAAAPVENSAGTVVVTKDEGDQDFAGPGEFLKAVRYAAVQPYNIDPRLKKLKATGMSEAIGTDGGFLLQEQYSGGVLERMYKDGEILNRVASDQVGPNSNGMTYFLSGETSRANGSRAGGIQGYWTGEAASITASKPTFDRARLELKKVAALTYLTDEQLEDTVWLGSYLQRLVPQELRFKVEDAIYNSAVGGPLGIMGHNCLVTVTRIDGSEIDATDVTNMWARRWAGVNDYVWLINQDATAQLNRMVLGDQPIYLPPGGISQAPYGTLMGKPVIEVEYAATLGTTGDLMLASLSQYQTIQKGGVKAAESIHVQFLTDETAYRFTYRIDGQPLWASALTPFKGSNTQSPFVVLSSTS